MPYRRCRGLSKCIAALPKYPRIGIASILIGPCDNSRPAIRPRNLVYSLGMNVGCPRKAKVSSIRRTLWLVCVATTVVPAVSTRAEDQAPAWATGCISVARESFTKESRVPEGYDRSEIQKLLFPEAMPATSAPLPTTFYGAIFSVAHCVTQ